MLFLLDSNPGSPRLHILDCESLIFLQLQSDNLNGILVSLCYHLEKRKYKYIASEHIEHIVSGLEKSSSIITIDGNSRVVGWM